MKMFATGVGAGILALGLLTSPAFAAPASASAAQQAEFYEACAARGDAALCKCKAEFAAETLDERMMGYVIKAMVADSPAPADVNDRWNDYIVGSTRACGSGV